MTLRLAIETCQASIEGLPRRRKEGVRYSCLLLETDVCIWQPGHAPITSNRVLTFLKVAHAGKTNQCQKKKVMKKILKLSNLYLASEKGDG